MFIESSRYYGQKVITGITRDGRKVPAITLRKLPKTEGEQVMIKGNDRLDIIAGHKYNDGTCFWHIADANRELRATHLVSQPGRIIIIPED